MLTVKPPQLNFNQDGIPCSQQFGDPYFSLINPLEDSRYVFLDSTNITRRWENKNFTIAELGFGFGINFITTANNWLKNKPKDQHLDYISFEKHPVQAPDLIRCYRHLGVSLDITKHLLKHYPLPVAGFHRIEFNEHNISLTLIFEEALDGLKQCNFEADAWYIDGFSPRKNPDLWCTDIANEIYRLTCFNGTFSTYSSASNVRKSFSQAGFEVSKKSGYGKKREMLIGQASIQKPKQSFKLQDKSWLLNTPSKIKTKKAIVIGAGMAGVCMSAALARRDWKVTLIDKNSTCASEASGNTNAILMPRLSVDHDLQSQLTLAGYLYSIRYLNTLQALSKEFTWQQCGAIQLPRDGAQLERMQKIASQEEIPESLLEFISKRDASQLSNCSLANEGWHIPLAGWLSPQQLCFSLLSLHNEHIELIANTKVYSIENKASQWVAYKDNEQEISHADVIIIANAHSTHQFSQTQWCQLHPKRGQISLVHKSECKIRPKKIICADAYITPETNDHYVMGATFITADTSIDIRESEHEENFSKIKHMIPSYDYSDTKLLKGRAGIRAVSSDRLPVVGPVANEIDFNRLYEHAALGSTRHTYSIPNYHDGLYLASGFGSRGLAWIPLCTEALACLLNEQVSPLSNRLLNAIHPNRILMKNLIKRVQSSP